MADRKIFLILIVIFVINNVKCSFRHSIHKRVEEINNISRVMYGDVTGDDFQKNNVEDVLMYPKGDRRKLSGMSSLWRQYYSCSARLLSQLSGSRTLPSYIVAVFQGAVARLPCGTCLAPGEKKKPRRWMVAKVILSSFVG
ncbi:uncharacterized protein LOC113502130 [Trichoplusia ni]|uniref:Uncharacterized protein LOC113502130 n=1 Tax=Trichoplusia ni TaxID=7111 RepID=A0A7E5WF47_TRINI|nr:uncharacterized protein LOC113502130 [Trichoplusia ni]